MNQRVSVVSAVLFGIALLWSLLLIVAAFALPLYTVSNVPPGPDGLQPRVTMFAQLGAISLLPPLAMVGAVLLCAALALLVPGWAGCVAGLVVSIAAVLASLAATVFFHLLGALLLPVGVLLVVALVVTLGQRASGTPSGVAPVPAVKS